MLNDYDILSAHGANRAHQDHFEATARFLLDSGAPITGLGMQGHFGASPTSMATVKRVLDRYAALGLSIRITEFDVNTADEALQADYTRDFLTMVFSHPAVTGFQMWGFWEGRALAAARGDVPPRLEREAERRDLPPPGARGLADQRLGPDRRRRALRHPRLLRPATT